MFKPTDTLPSYVICKKSIYNFRPHRKYKVDGCYDDPEGAIEAGYENMIFKFIFKIENKKAIKLFRTENETSNRFMLFSDYFCSLNDERKLKLKKIQKKS